MEARASQADQTETPRKGRRLRGVFWIVLLAAAAAVLIVSLSSREEVKTSEENAAFRLDFPKGFDEATSTVKTLALTNSDDATVILNPNTNDPPVSIKDARTRLHRLSCKANTSVTKGSGGTVVTANAPRPCDLFASTATVLGPTHRVTLSCSAPKQAQATAACSEVLANLQVK